MRAIAAKSVQATGGELKEARRAISIGVTVAFVNSYSVPLPEAPNPWLP